MNAGLSRRRGREGFGEAKQHLSNAYHEVLHSTARLFAGVIGGGMTNNRAQLKQDRFHFCFPPTSRAGEEGCPGGLCSLHAWRLA